MIPVKLRPALLFFFFSSVVFADGEDSAGRENLAAALKAESVAFTERTAESETGGTEAVIWAYIPSTEKEEDAPPDAGSAVAADLIGQYTGSAGEIPAAFSSSDDIPIELPANSLVLVIPFSSGPGENGLSWSAGMGIEFIRKIKRQYRKRGVAVVFPERGEDGGKSEGVLQEIYTALDNPEESILLFLDFPEPPGELSIYHGSLRNIAPLEILKPLTSLLEEQDVPYSFANRFNELYKFSLAGGNPVTDFTQSRGIPSLFISSINSTDSIEASLPSSLPPGNLAGVLAEYSKEIEVEAGNLDTHYSIYHFRGKTFFVSEILLITQIIFIHGGIIIVFLFFSLFRRLKMIILIRAGFGCSWLSLLYFFSLFLSILAGEGIFYAFISLFRVSLSTLLLNRLYTAIGLALLVGTSLFFALPSSLLSLIQIRRRGGFYGFTAIGFSIILLLLGIILDISTAPLLTWMLVCISLAMVLSHAVPAFIFSLVLVIRPAFVFASAFANGELSRLFLSNSIFSALIAALAALPFIFSLMRAMVFAIPYRIRKRPVFLFIKAGFFILSVIIAALYLKNI
jgi:hypothetical protein